MSRTIGLIGVCVASMYTTTAVSQVTARAAESTGTLEEVVVTATKRTESLQDVPISINALTSKDMQIAGVKDIRDVVASTPGVEFQQAIGFNLTRIEIRGIDSSSGTSTTGVYIDDTAVQSRINANSVFGNPYPVTFDLNRVEVARGPQGTLFGAGAEGGAVRFIFNKPDLHNYSGQASAELATTEHGGLSYETGLAVGGPIVSDRLGFRASAWQRTDGGYVDRVDPFTGATVDEHANRDYLKAFRVAFEGAPTDWLTVTPSFLYQRSHNHDASDYMGYLSNADQGSFKTGGLVANPMTDTFNLTALNIDLDLHSVKLAAVTSYFDRSATFTGDGTNILGALGANVGLPGGVNGFGNPLGPEYPVSYSDASPQPMTFAQRVLTQEIRLSSTDPAARVSWVAGLFYSKSTQRDIFNYYSDDVTVPNGLPLGTSILDTETKVNDTQLAAFGQADIEIAQGLKLSTGLRVARTKFDETTLSAGLFNFGTPPVASGGTSETPITPKVALSYKLDDTLYYASVAKGYRTGGVNSPIPSYCSRPATEFFSSDNVWSYEIGAKSSLADNRLRIDVSAFHIRWNNIQQAVALTDCGYGYIANTGEAVSNGFDLSVNAIPMKDLTVGLGVAYTSAHFTKDVTVDDLPIVRNGDAIGTLIGGTALSPWSVSLTANREFALPFAGATGYLWAQDIYHSKNPGPFTSDIPGGISYNPDLVTNPSMNRVNFRFGIRSDSYDISLFVNNAFDTHPNLNKSLLAGVASPIVSYSTLRPRTVGLSAAYHF